MAIAFALYGGLLHGMEPHFEALFRWTSLAISIPALVWGGGVFFRGALGAVRARSLHMDIPISLGIAAGFGHGIANTIRGGGPVYFESVTMLIFLLLAGRWIQMRRQRSSADSAELLAALSPSTARLIVDDRERVVPAESLVPGMRVRVRPGDLFPADGRVVSGESSVNTALLTGESRPVEVSTGSPVHAGTMNLSSPLDVEIHSTGEETRVGRVLRLVEEYAARRAPIVLLADRLSGIFVAAVLLLAAITFALWASRGAGLALDHAIALLIVTCPCALGLSTPLATTLSIGQAARAGILVKGGDVLEALTQPGRVWLDKTGTLTEGLLRVVERAGPERIWSLVAEAERHSNHPVGRALANRAGPSEEGAVRVGHIRETPGGGIEATVDGREIVIGSPGFVQGRCGPAGAPWEARLRRWADAGLTPVLVAADGAVVAAAALGDPLRPDAVAVVERLRIAGWRVGILSGDHPAVVACLGRALGMAPGDALGGLSPEEKCRTVAARKASETVVMIGDGVNDAAALAAADIGIAVHGGAEAALAASDVYVTRSGVGPVLELMDGARRTMRTIRWNLGFSLLYNVVGAALAMGGLINPIAAAILMPLSSLTVVGATAASRMFPLPGERP
jgi:Cu2+-exporting ATPase